MNRAESIIVGLFVGISCPLLTFVLFWWTTAAIHLHVPGVPVRVVIAVALAGLALGLLLDMAFLRRWVKKFYTANVWLMVTVYLGLSAVAVAFFMGLPVGTFLLGIAAGIYVGRRERHALAAGTRVALALRRTAFLAASVTAVAAFPIGILALHEQSLIGFLERALGFDKTGMQGGSGLTLVILLSLALFAFQYGSTKKAGQLAFSVGGSDVQPGAPAEAQ